MCDFNANLDVFITKVIFSIEVGFNLRLPLTKLKSALAKTTNSK